MEKNKQKTPRPAKLPTGVCSLRDENIPFPELMFVINHFSG